MYSILVETESQWSEWRMGVMCSCLRTHQDPSCRVLDVLEPLQALARDPDEKCVPVVQSGGDKGMDQFFGV